jgi:hypothetical protein
VILAVDKLPLLSKFDYSRIGRQFGRLQPEKIMISNERPSPYGRRPYQGSSQGYGLPKPQVQEDTLKSEAIQIERKTFVLTLKENPRGRFLRITEDVGGRRDTIIIPSTGLEDFKKLVNEMVKASNEIPEKK